MVPAEELRLSPALSGENVLTGVIKLKTFHGPLTRIELDVQGHRWLSVLPSSDVDAYAMGDVLRLPLSPESCHVIREG
jgi:hypothetical protein